MKDIYLLHKKHNNNEGWRENVIVESFEVKKDELLRVEAQIYELVGRDIERIRFEVVSKYKEEIELLLDQRRFLLNWMFLETPLEVERMRIVNSRLFELMKRLTIKMADVCESLMSRERDDFDDDYEVMGSLRFSYNGEESVRPYDGDGIYGTNFPFMIHLNDLFRFQEKLPYLELFCRYTDKREDILKSGNCDHDNLSWVHEIPGNFDGIYICHTTAVFCRDFGFPLVDVLHMNDFWNEVVVRFQQFATQDPDYKYLRE